jgi:hypothetical protein
MRRSRVAIRWRDIHRSAGDRPAGVPAGSRRSPGTSCNRRTRCPGDSDLRSPVAYNSPLPRSHGWRRDALLRSGRSTRATSCASGAPEIRAQPRGIAQAEGKRCDRSAASAARPIPLGHRARARESTDRHRTLDRSQDGDRPTSHRLRARHAGQTLPEHRRRPIDLTPLADCAPSTALVLSLAKESAAGVSQAEGRVGPTE